MADVPDAPLAPTISALSLACAIVLFGAAFQAMPTSVIGCRRGSKMLAGVVLRLEAAYYRADAAIQKVVDLLAAA
jgi:hypothetical protein